MEKSKVYFTQVITPERIVEMYEKLGHPLPGKVAVKLHSGEPGNQNYLRPELWKDAIDKVNGTIVECNTAYEGRRNNSERHWQTMNEHGWTAVADVDIMDEDGDTVLPVENGNILDVNFVGKHLDDYDSMLVLTHFKGHPMGGFGGALKNISIGVASQHGKLYIHGAKDIDKGALDLVGEGDMEHDLFLEAMADAAGTVDKKFGENILYINVMKNMSVDCDCCRIAENPCMKDVGILASTDPVAVDQACIDLVYASEDPGRAHLVERIESRNGIHTIAAAEKIGVGSRDYELINIDEA